MSTDDDTPAEPARPLPAPEEGERIAKALSRAGVASRRDAERLVIAGRVSVNGEVVTSPATNVLAGDRLAVDGVAVPPPEAVRLWLYHKPAGLVTTEKDEEGRETVFDALPEEMPRVMSIGRLDLTSEGLLLLTNDGEVKRKLELPATGWTRRYRVRIHGSLSEADLDRLRSGITVDGVDYLPMEVTFDRQTGANAWLTVALKEGKNREIRRVMEHLGVTVNRLIRVSYGPFQLGDLPVGEVEEVKPRIVRDQLGLAAPEPEPSRRRKGETTPAAAPARAPRPARPALATRLPEGAAPVRRAIRPRGPAAEGEERTSRRPRSAGADRREREDAPFRRPKTWMRPGEEPKPEATDDERPRGGKGAPRSAGHRSHADRDGERGPRPARAGGFRGPKPEGDARPPRPRREGDERPPRPRRDNRGDEGRSGGTPRPARPAREEGERKPRWSKGESRPPGGDGSEGGERPRRFTGSASRPSGGRDERPARGDRPSGNRPSGSGRAGSTRTAGDRPGGKPWAERKPGGARPSSGGPRAERDGTTRPPRGGKPGGASRPGGGRPGSDRPGGGARGPRAPGGRPGGGRPKGPRKA
jgi:23S rRNA pseudouridine2605 synthase